jgi:hypothetical protein
MSGDVLYYTLCIGGLSVWAAVSGPLDWQRLVGFTIGGVICYGLCLWYESQSGRTTRRIIGNTWAEILEYAEAVRRKARGAQPQVCVTCRFYEYDSATAKGFCCNDATAALELVGVTAHNWGCRQHDPVQEAKS